MSLLLTLVEWTQRTFEPLGAWGLFILAFIESSVFPIPPDLLLIVLSLAEPQYALWFALVCTLGSTLGGMFGYLIGYVGEQAVLERFFDRKKIEKVHRLFNKYEVWAIAIAGFTPVPYKVFTIAGGVFYIDFKKFVLVSFLSRGARFTLEALLIMFYGPQIVTFLDANFNGLSLLAAVVLLGGYFMHKRLRSSAPLPPY